MVTTARQARPQAGGLAHWVKPCFSKRLYRARNLIERFFSNKLAANFLAMIQLASMRLWLRAYEPTA